jgi:hypothetical protein
MITASDNSNPNHGAGMALGDHPGLPGPAPVLRRLRRWKQENNGWTDLTQYWAFQHGFAARLPPPSAKGSPPG